jgi:hypothetical protein
MLHGQPAVVAVLRVGVDAESQLLDIEFERLVLIVDVDTNDADTLGHGTSVSSSAPFIAAAS